MKRIIFIIDGFNLYHSILSIYYKTKKKYKWLNIDSLCRSYLDRYGKVDQVELVDIFYFTALKEHLRLVNPGTVKRHEDYIKCLKSEGVKVIINNFKDKEVWCKAVCKQKFNIYQEKETDVAIAAKLFEVFVRNLCDIAVIITGDTDLKPAYTTALELFPEKLIEFAFPFDRKNKSLVGFKIKIDRYSNNLFPNPVVLADGTQIAKPASW